MVSEVFRAFSEIRSSFNKLFLLDAYIGSLLIFLLCFLTIVIFRIKSEYSYIISGLMALLFFLFNTIRFSFKDKLAIVESKYPKLKEKLRTARDIEGINNPVAVELRNEVLTDLNMVEESEFISFRKTTFLTLLLVLFCFSILFASTLNIYSLPVISNVVSTIGNIKNTNLKIIFPGQNEPGSGGKDPVGFNDEKKGIFGQKRLTQIGSTKQEVTVMTASTEVDLTKASNPDSQDKFGEAFPDEIGATASVSNNENIPKDKEELVKQYFQ